MCQEKQSATFNIVGYVGYAIVGRHAFDNGGTVEVLDDVAAQWDAITKKRGVEKQRRSYLSYLKQTGSSREMTAAARGLAVKC